MDDATLKPPVPVLGVVARSSLCVGVPSDLSEDGGAPPAPPPAAAIAVFFFLYGWSAAPRKMRLGQNRPPTGEEGWMSGSRQKRSEGPREQTNT